MQCPKCGGEKTKVRNTRRVEDKAGEVAIMRYRHCEACGLSFQTYESYELADCEASFDRVEMQGDIQRACDWLRIAAIHIPVVRDARKILLRHVA